MSEPLADIEAERTIIGAVLVDNATMNEAAALLEPKHFSDLRHRVIWEAALALYEHNSPLDMVTLKDQLGSDWGKAGGREYVPGLIDGVPRITDIKAWCRIVLDWSQKRSLVWLAERALTEVKSGQYDVAELLERHQELLTKLMTSRQDGVVPIKDALKGAMERLEQFATSKNGMLGVPCGLPDIDRVIGGWQKGALYVVAARPGRGKSVLCTQAAIHAALTGRKVLTFNMEMVPEETAQRMLCSHAGVDKWDLRQRPGQEQVFNQAWDGINRSFGVLARLPIYFDKRETPTIAQIRATARQHQAAKGCDLLIVDYIQRCQKPAGVDGWVAVGQIVEGLKNLALALQIPVLAACQVNAEGEERRPHMGMLAEARGKISAEADMIAFLHPEQPELWEQHDFPNMLFMMAKHRNGPTLTIPLSFERPNVRFVCLPEGVKPDPARRVA